MTESLLMARLPNTTTWFALPTPSWKNYHTEREHKEKSFLDANGFFHRDIVRRSRNKVFCGYDALTGEQTALLDNLYDYDYFYLRFTNNQNNRVECKVYSGPLKGVAAMMDARDFRIKWRTSVQVNFIEY